MCRRVCTFVLRGGGLRIAIGPEIATWPMLKQQMAATKSFVRAAAASPLAGILRGGTLSRTGSDVHDASESTDLRRPPAPRSPEAWKPRGGCCCSTAVEDEAGGAPKSTGGSVQSEGATVASPRATELRDVVSPGARHNWSARNSLTRKSSPLFGGMSAGGGLGGVMLGGRSASAASMRHSPSAGSDASDADAIVSYGNGPPEAGPRSGIRLSGPTPGIRFHGSQAEAAPGEGGPAGAWDDPFVASRPVDQLLDALAMAGIAELDVLQRLMHRCMFTHILRPPT